METLVFADLGGSVGDYHIAVTHLRPGQVSFLHTHDFFEVFLVELGKGMHCINGEAQPLRRGDLVFIRQTDEHSYRSSIKEPLGFINLAFSSRWWKSFLSLFDPPLAFAKAGGKTPEPVHLSGAEALACGGKMHDLLEWGTGAPALFPETVALLVRHLTGTSKESPQHDKGPGWLQTLLRELGDPELVRQPIRFWQQRSGVSAAHFSRACRQYQGVTPTELLNRARIAQIKARLRRGEDKVASLALDAGYQNLGYFYRIFRQFEGCTPRQWLRQRASLVTVPR